MDANEKYKDIINLPHHVSETRTRMSVESRAAQFLPFAALSGYDDAVRESARRTGEKKELAEDARAALDEALRRAAGGTEEAEVTYFVPDARKSGGEYVTARGRIKRVDPVAGLLYLSGGERISIEDILSVDAGRE
ncbi:MAG: YolD-like family protein [Butyricicoccus sp.]|nr:YolD-like family protein [Butyricicoccus sp.]